MPNPSAATAALMPATAQRWVVVCRNTPTGNSACANNVPCDNARLVHCLYRGVSAAVVPSVSVLAQNGGAKYVVSWEFDLFVVSCLSVVSLMTICVRVAVASSPCFTERSLFSCSASWPVSYTHLDVYKRQLPRDSADKGRCGRCAVV